MGKLRVAGTAVILAIAVGATSAAWAHGRGQRPDRCERVATSIERLETIVGNGHPWSFFQSFLERLLDGVQVFYVDECVHLNQLQVLGTHNSYHIQPRPPLFATLVAFDPQLAAWGYTHRPLGEQFAELGMRKIELDVFADPDGGKYASRAGLLAIGQDPASGEPALDEPGFKVLHVQDLDFETTCLTFVACLEQLKTWSDANRRHVPVMVLVEAKDDAIPDPLNLGFQVPVPFDAPLFDALDDEIRSVFPRHRLIVPDDIRRPGQTLEQSVLERGWPKLRRARGRILFALDNGGAKRDLYKADHPSLSGRVMFTNGTPGDDDAAFVKRNDPLGDPTEIPALVEAGYIVRTRADADTIQAVTNDPTRRDAALASGAQFVSTDYPEPDPSLSDYSVTLPGGGIARCNPINAPRGCRDGAVRE